MKFEFPSTQQIPLRGRIERFGSVAALVLELSQAGAIGVIKIGRLELHLAGQWVTHGLHEGLDPEAAVVTLLQIERGNYAFFAQDPVRNMQLSASLVALSAMQQLDESRVLRPQAGLVVLPNLNAALEYIGGLGGLKQWTAQFLYKSGLLFERSQMRVLALGVTLEELGAWLTKPEAALLPLQQLPNHVAK
jgi:hypothetical protein